MLQQTAEIMQEAALKAVDPYLLIKNNVRFSAGILCIGQKEWDLNSFAHVYVAGFGKAVAPMAEALEELLDGYLTAGVILVKYGHQQALKKIRVLQAAHPIPDENCLQGSKEIISLVNKAGKDDLVIVLISGGGSSLFEQLPADIDLQDLAAFNDLLISCGARIEEINTLRKHISMVKGGRLAKMIAPAQTLSVILSDVIGDPLESIASGPTVADPTTFAQAQKIIRKYRMSDLLPQSIKTHLQKGAAGLLADTPKSNEAFFEKVQNIILGNNRLALQVLEKTAAEAGYRPFVLSDRIQGEARDVALVLAAALQSAQDGAASLYSPACLIMGGEPTVTLKGKGKGGRNQELVLAFLLAMGRAGKPFYFCSIGTDGTDGPTEAAGAWIDERSFRKALDMKLDMEQFLDNNDSFHFFEKMEQLIITGPTRTNVMDIMFCLF